MQATICLGNRGLSPQINPAVSVGVTTRHLGLHLCQRSCFELIAWTIYNGSKGQRHASPNHKGGIKRTQERQSLTQRPSTSFPPWMKDPLEHCIQTNLSFLLSRSSAVVPLPSPKS
jgi:hypothetical protein